MDVFDPCREALNVFSRDRQHFAHTKTGIGPALGNEPQIFAVSLYVVVEFELIIPREIGPFVPGNQKRIFNQCSILKLCATLIQGLHLTATPKIRGIQRGDQRSP